MARSPVAPVGARSGAPCGPIGIIAALVICTILYASVALVLTRIIPWTKLRSDSPVADALKGVAMNRLRVIVIVTAGALMGMMSSLLVYQ